MKKMIFALLMLSFGAKAQDFTVKGKTLYIHNKVQNMHLVNLPYSVERKSFKGSFIPLGHDLAYKWRKTAINGKYIRFKYLVFDEGKFWAFQ